MSAQRMTPNYTTIREYQLPLRAIPSIQTYLGHLATQEFVATNGNRPFIEPANPGLTLTSGTTTRTIAKSIRNFTFQQNEYMKYQATISALRNLILNAIGDKCILGLKHEILSYANVSPFELMTYIWTFYGKIDDTDRTLNEHRMKAPWNPPTYRDSL